MFVYHDMNYVEYILDSEIETGIFLYNLCIERLNDIEKKDFEDKLFQIYLQDSQGISFEDFKKIHYSKNQPIEVKKADINRIQKNIQEMEARIKNGTLKSRKIDI